MRRHGIYLQQLQLRANRTRFCNPPTPRKPTHVTNLPDTRTLRSFPLSGAYSFNDRFSDHPCAGNSGGSRGAVSKGSDRRGIEATTSTPRGPPCFSTELERNKLLAVVDSVAVEAPGMKEKPQPVIMRLQLIQSETVRSPRFQLISITR